MSEDINSKGPAPIQFDPKTLQPAPEVKPEAKPATLSLQHVDGVPQILATGGNAIPSSLQVMNAEGKAVARFEVLDFDILPKDDPMGFLDVDVDSFMLDRAATIDVKPEDIGQLALENRDGQTVLVVNRGKFIPARLTVVDAAGNTVARLAARNNSDSVLWESVALLEAPSMVIFGVVGYQR